MLLFILGSVKAGANTTYSPEEIEPFIRSRSEKVSDTSSRIYLSLQIPDLTRLNGRHYQPIMLAGPIDGGLKVELEKFSYFILQDDDTVLGPFDSEGENELGMDVSDLGLIRLRMIDQFRSVGQYKAELEISKRKNFTLDGNSRGYTLIINGMQLLASFEKEDPDKYIPDLKEYDPYSIVALGKVVLNPEQILTSAMQIDPPIEYEAQTKWNELMRDAAARGPVLLYRLREGGVYGIDGTVLRDAGVSPESLPVDEIVVMLGNEELPCLPFEVNDPFLAGDAKLLFYVPHDKSDKAPYLPLWIIRAGEEQEPLRLTPKGFEARGVIPIDRPAVVQRRIFKPNEYLFQIDLNSPNLRWVTSVIGYGNYEEFEFQAPEEIEKTGPASVQIFYTTTNPRSEGELVAYLNRERIGQVNARSTNSKEVQFNFDAALLKPGTNILSLEASTEGDNGSWSAAFIEARINIPVPTRSIYHQDPFTISADETTSYTAQFNTYNTEGGSGYLFDLEDPLRPEVQSLRIIGRSGVRQFNGKIDVAEGENTFVLVEPSITPFPTNVERVQFPELFFRSSALDYLLIYHSDLQEALPPFLQHRSKNRRVEAVNVEDIYKVYSYGWQKTSAICDVIHHCYIDREGKRLSEVLLVGEASEFWWEYRFPDITASKNMVPVYGWQDPAERIRGDEGYTLFSGVGPLPDVELGRISANNTDELSTIVDKIIAYETSPPGGMWRNRNLFVLDDEAEFLKVAKAIVSQGFSGSHEALIYGLHDFVYEDYFRGFWRKRSVEMTDAIVKALNDGARTVTYLGHGGPNLWSGERIFHIRDIDRTESNGKFPVLIAGSCDTGWIDYPVPPVNTSLSEHFLRRENGGMVAAYIPVEKASSYEHELLILSFYEALQQKSTSDVGELCLYSKLKYFQYRASQKLTKQFVLMGDPALSIVPLNSFDKLTVEPSRVLSTSPGKLSVTATASRMEASTLKVALLGKTHEPIVEQQILASGKDREFEFELELPAWLEPGEYVVSVSGGNEEDSFHISGSETLTVEKTEAELVFKRQDLAEEFRQLAVTSPVTVTITNKSRLPLSDIQFDILDASTGRVLEALPVDLPALSAVDVDIPPRLVEEFEKVSARLSVEGNNGNGERVAIAETEIFNTASMKSGRYLSLPLSGIEVRHLSDFEGTEFVLPLYNVTSEDLGNIRIRLKDLDQEGRPEIAPLQTIQRLEAGSREEVTFKSERSFRSAEKTFAMEVYGWGDNREVPLQVEVFSLSLKDNPNLMIIPGSFYLERDAVPQKNTVFARMTIRNNGNVPMKNITAALWVNEPWKQENRAESSIPWYDQNNISELFPGDEKELRVRWDPGPFTDNSGTLYATVESGNSDAQEEDMTDNVASQPFRFIEAPNLRLTKENIKVSKNYAEPYQIISFQVPVENNSDRDFLRRFRVTGAALSRSGERRQQFSHRFDELLAGDSAVITFDWQIEPDEYQYIIELNPDREYLETTHRDNDAEFIFPYILPETFITSEDGTWEFGRFPDYGTITDLKQLGSRALVLTQRPGSDSLYRSIERGYFVEGTLGPYKTVDNLWELDGTDLWYQYGEDPPSVKLRIPLDQEDGVTLYELYINHVGNFFSDKNSGQFRYRLENNPEWKLFNRNARDRVYMERVETHDDFLDIELSPPDYPSVNQIRGFYLNPVKGSYRSPIIKLKGPAERYLSAEMDLPENTSIQFAIRSGSEGKQEIDWNDWIDISPDRSFKAGVSDDLFFQWRATLVGSAVDTPSLKDVRIKKGSPQQSDSSESQEVARIP